METTPKNSGSSDLAKVTNDLADALAMASTWIFNFRRTNAKTRDQERLRNLESALDLKSIDLRAKAINLLGGQTADAIKQLQTAAREIDAFMQNVKNAEAALGVVSAALGLAAAALVGDIPGIIVAVLGVDKAVDGGSARKSGKSAGNL